VADRPAADRTERATPKRLQEARDKGQVARSRELTTMAVLLAAAGGLFMTGDRMVGGIVEVMRDDFQASRADIMDANVMTLKLGQAIGDAVMALAPFLALVTLAALLAPLALGGWSFSAKAFAFKWDKLDPVKGLGRVFSVRGLVELAKALAKFAIVLAVALAFLWNHVGELLSLGGEGVESGLAHAAALLRWAFLFMSAAMIVIAAVDAPFQLWDYQRQLRMTRQEVRDEYRETDGSPEVKRRVREVRNELARRRMMEAVPRADVIITNPTHYAVALRYEQSRMAAPVVVAKGKDLVAQQIRNLGVVHRVPIVSAPPLARALYHSTRLQQQIPSGLFLAVAQVLAYAYQLRRQPHRRRGRSSFDDLPIPDDLRVDE
jgi:flagellar biosynthetic protein FlhB